MREVDRLMVEEAGISLPQMMENAGRSLAALVIALHGDVSVTVLAGKGGNGGGGLAAARHLANRGAQVAVTTASAELSPVTQLQLEIVRKMGVAQHEDPQPSRVVVDALVGYSLTGDPRGRSAELIEWTNQQDSPIVALDVPSGVEPDTGQGRNPAVHATTTLTLALPKVGLARCDLAGDLYLADISVPRSVYRSVDIEVPADLFADGQVLALSP